MAYGSTPYVGMVPKKNGGHIKSIYDWVFCVASFPGSPEHELYMHGEPGIFST